MLCRHPLLFCLHGNGFILRTHPLRLHHSSVPLLLPAFSTKPTSSPFLAAPPSSSSSSPCSDTIEGKHLKQLREISSSREEELRLHGLSMPSSDDSRQLFPILQLLNNSPRLRAVLLLNLLTLLYGSNIPIIKQMESTLDPSLFLCGRFALATMVFSPFISNGLKNAKLSSAGLELGLWISMGYMSQSLGLLTCDAGRASFISAFTVIVVPFLAGISGKEISRLTWVSAIMAFVGVGFLETSGSPPTLGDLWSLISAVLFAVHMLRTEHYSRVFTQRQLLPLLSLQLLVITLSSSLCYLASNMILKQSFRAIDLNVLDVPWAILAYTGIISTALCLWIEMAAMKEVSATDTAIIYSLEPLWGASFSWFLLGERWNSKSWLGGLLILGGSVAVQLIQAQVVAKGNEKSEKL